MNISEGFIRRPIATSLLMAGIALFGVIAYRALPVSDLPQVDYPTITVSASLPGANPNTMASAVATPLERQFTTIAGLDSMISNSSQGSTNITLQFDLSRDIDGATVDVETAIAEAMPLLPPGMPTPPSFRKANPGDSAHHQHLPDVAHHAAFRSGRVRRDHGGAAHFDGGRRCAGAGFRFRQVCGAGAGGSQYPGIAADRTERGRGGAAAIGTSTSRPARFTGRHTAYQCQGQWPAHARAGLQDR